MASNTKPKPARPRALPEAWREDARPGQQRWVHDVTARGHAGLATASLEVYRVDRADAYPKGWPWRWRVGVGGVPHARLLEATGWTRSAAKAVAAAEAIALHLLTIKTGAAL